MNTLMRLGLLGVIVLTTFNLTAQQTKISTRKSVELNPKSEAQKVVINVEQGIDVLHLVVNCRLVYGQVTAELYNPKGKRIGKLSLGGAATKESPQEEEGKLDTIIQEPMAGEWRIMVLPVGAKAVLKVSSTSSANTESGQK